MLEGLQMGDQSRQPPVTGYPAPLQASAGHPNANGYPTAGTAYPYHAPPPPQNYPYPNHYYAQNPYIADDRRHICLRRVFAAIVAATIITGTVIFIVWLVLRPRVPQFHVDSLTLTNFNVSPNSLSGNWNAKFAVRNPNKKISISYDPIEASIYYKSKQLSETMIPPFRQGTRNETTTQASFAASSVYVEQRVVDGINSDRSRGNLEFIVRIWARVGLSSGAWKVRRRALSVLCGGLSVGISSNSSTGSLMGGSKQCRVGL